MFNLRRTFSIFSAALSMAIAAFKHLATQVAEYVLQRFDWAPAVAVRVLCAVGHSLKNVVYSFSVKSNGQNKEACHGFVSLRHSLDAAAA